MKSLILLSGGLDSAVLLADSISRGRQIALALNLYYGSKHGNWEGKAAEAVAGHYKVTLGNVHLRGLFDYGKSSSALLSTTPVPEGHYNEENMRQTVVPGRNLVFIAAAAAVAEAQGIDRVLIAAHVGDHHIYPDCRVDFLASADGAIRTGSGGKVELHYPFSLLNKYEIVKRGIALQVPFHLTRTCYTDRAVACGRCGSCQERLEAFAMNGEPDPLEYETRELLTKS
jgi:7-cyano-7-deazaguanine synthase